MSKPIFKKRREVELPQSWTLTSVVCPDCGGTKVCPYCGNKTGNGCAECGHTGKCPHCYGE